MPLLSASTTSLVIEPRYQPMAQELNLTLNRVFADPQIKPWRTLADRENCTWQTPAGRWHVKRYPTRAALADVNGVRLLQQAKIPTAPLVAHGSAADGRSFVIFDDLQGYTPADKLIEAGQPFEPLIQPTADLAARLHHVGLHHRDLYLCHFMARIDDAGVKLALIDTARVARLGWVLLRGRWIVKDVAQFWYSSTKLPISDEQRDAWLKRYAEQRGLPSCVGLKTAVLRKSAWIAKHDQSLNEKQPERNVSIP